MLSGVTKALWRTLLAALPTIDALLAGAPARGIGSTVAADRCRVAAARWACGGATGRKERAVVGRPEALTAVRGAVLASGSSAAAGALRVAATTYTLRVAATTAVLRTAARRNALTHSATTALIDGGAVDARVATASTRVQLCTKAAAHCITASGTSLWPAGRRRPFASALGAAEAECAAVQTTHSAEPTRVDGCAGATRLNRVAAALAVRGAARRGPTGTPASGQTAGTASATC
jgi:hypothetical protein